MEATVSTEDFLRLGKAAEDWSTWGNATGRIAESWGSLSYPTDGLVLEPGDQTRNGGMSGTWICVRSHAFDWPHAPEKLGKYQRARPTVARCMCQDAAEDCIHRQELNELCSHWVRSLIKTGPPGPACLPTVPLFS